VRALDKGLRISVFREPDLGDAMTSIAFEPAAHRLLQPYELALQEAVVP
jgi:hypothetical protein